MRSASCASPAGPHTFDYGGEVAAVPVCAKIAVDEFMEERRREGRYWHRPKPADMSIGLRCNFLAPADLSTSMSDGRES